MIIIINLHNESQNGDRFNYSVIQLHLNYSKCKYTVKVL